MWNYEKLFAEGNVISVSYFNTNNIKYIVQNKENWYKLDVMDWEYFKNNNLSFGNGQIEYIAKLDNHGNSTVLFDRERDIQKPMPELKTGMFVRIIANGLGFVDAENNRIIYQYGGFDYIDDNNMGKGVASKIVEVYSKNTCGFDCCSEFSLIWRDKNYKYLQK